MVPFAICTLQSVFRDGGQIPLQFLDEQGTIGGCVALRTEEAYWFYVAFCFEVAEPAAVEALYYVCLLFFEVCPSNGCATYVFNC